MQTVTCNVLIQKNGLKTLNKSSLLFADNHAIYGCAGIHIIYYCAVITHPSRAIEINCKLICPYHNHKEDVKSSFKLLGHTELLIIGCGCL